MLLALLIVDFISEAAIFEASGVYAFNTLGANVPAPKIQFETNLKKALTLLPKLPPDKALASYGL
ncbi:hypothetical protein Lpp14_08936 [Lacticaseibacillus paracasei subsp. paracasei Lpp14]|uniref:Uncharacterized protein n=1 Tax=Lacticaseibacillus paracasei subsp. paracasei Lpp14 TaxID=1256204 RepID=A0A829GPB4_LACPA|nr:hypothetical protein Lpp14_08936 [Lacticaseibacillus paracasei subsp. paracasei Lpp14]